MLIIAHKLWYDGELATGMCEAPINCDQLVGATPRDAYLVPSGTCCGGPAYNLSLSLPSPYPAGTLQGVWIELKDGSGMMIDALSAQDVINACDGCCGTAPVIAGRYGDGVLPVPGPPQAATYTFTRTDLENWYSYNKASLDYYGQYIPGTFMRTGYTNGVSTYQFQAYKDPIWIAGDTMTNETNRVFPSNVAPTLVSGNEYNVNISTDKGPMTPALTGATVAALVTALQGNATYNAMGTWAVAGGNTITLTTSTVQYASILIGQQLSS